MINISREFLKTKDKFDIKKIIQMMKQNPNEAVIIQKIIDNEFDSRLKNLIDEAQSLKIRTSTDATNRILRITNLIDEISSEKEDIRIKLIKNSLWK